MLQSVDGKEVATRVIHIAGSIRTAQRSAIKHNVAAILESGHRRSMAEVRICIYIDALLSCRFLFVLER